MNSIPSSALSLSLIPIFNGKIIQRVFSPGRWLALARVFSDSTRLFLDARNLLQAQPSYTYAVYEKNKLFI